MLDKEQIIKIIENNNAKKDLYNKYLQSIINTINKYAGKQLGEMTKTKIQNELKEKTNCNCYIYSDSITIYTTDENGFNGRLKTDICLSYPHKILTNNQIQKININNCYCRDCQVMQDPQSTYDRIHELYDEAIKIDDRLREISSEISKLLCYQLDLVKYTYNIK